MAAPTNVTRIIVEVDPDLYRAFYGAFPRGTPSHLIRAFATIVVDLVKQGKAYDVLAPLLEMGIDFDRQAILKRMVEEYNNGKG